MALLRAIRGCTISPCRALPATPSLTSKEATRVSFSFQLARPTSINSGASVPRKQEIGFILSNQVIRAKSLVPPHPQLPQCVKAISCVVVVRAGAHATRRNQFPYAKCQLGRSRNNTGAETLRCVTWDSQARRRMVRQRMHLSKLRSLDRTTQARRKRRLCLLVLTALRNETSQTLGSTTWRRRVSETHSLFPHRQFLDRLGSHRPLTIQSPRHTTSTPDPLSGTIGATREPADHTGPPVVDLRTAPAAIQI